MLFRTGIFESMLEGLFVQIIKIFSLLLFSHPLESSHIEFHGIKTKQDTKFSLLSLILRYVLNLLWMCYCVCVCVWVYPSINSTHTTASRHLPHAWERDLIGRVHRRRCEQRICYCLFQQGSIKRKILLLLPFINPVCASMQYFGSVCYCRDVIKIICLAGPKRSLSLLLGIYY